MKIKNFSIILALFAAIILIFSGCSASPNETNPVGNSQNGATPSNSNPATQAATSTSTSGSSPTSNLPPTSNTSTSSIISQFASTTISASKITSNPSTENGKTMTITGQTFLTGSPPKVLIDGESGVNIIGNTGNLEQGYYSLTGTYNSDTNTLNVAESQKQDVQYQVIATAENLAQNSGVDLIPTSVDGLIATPPKEIANELSSYLNIPYLPKDTPIYPYVVYTQNGFYLALSDTNISLPTKFSVTYQGKDYSFTFSAGEVKGTLIKTPLDKINFGNEWQPAEFNGVIVADNITAMQPVQATVKDIENNPGQYAFKRVSINGDYAVTTATVNYSDVQAPMGIGLLADNFGDFFNNSSNLRLETIDPGRKAWQLRQSTITGTVIYPTEQILKYLDYSAPLSKAQIMQNVKPALIVDTLADDIVNVANISELNPLTGNPSKYWGKVVQFEGYAIGTQVHLQDVAQAISGAEIPIDVTMYAVGVGDNISVGSQLAIIGLSNDVNKGMLEGKFKFMVAVTHVGEELTQGVPYADTAFFLLDKEQLPMTLPTTLPTISPTPLPTLSPTPLPTISPTPLPTISPRPLPTYSPPPTTTILPPPTLPAFP